MTQKVEEGSRWLSNKGTMGVVKTVNGVKRMHIILDGRTVKTLTIQKLSRDDWSKLDWF